MNVIASAVIPRNFNHFVLAFLLCVTVVSTCPHPPVPIHAQIELSPALPSKSESQLVPKGTTATYTCDSGYTLFGSPSLSCLDTGTWSGDLPYCAVNVAYGKPTNQSSTSRGGNSNNANDGDLSTVHENKYCTQTRKENSPWWMVDLLQPYQIRVVRILTRGCCGHNHLQDIEIRVGNSSLVQGNRLCAWFPGTLDDGVTKDFACARPLTGRYVYIQMVGIEGMLSLCEVSVFTTDEFSSQQCSGNGNTGGTSTFNKTCFEFQISSGGTLQQAEQYCSDKQGHVLYDLNAVKHNYIIAELNRIKSEMKTQLVWIGAKRQTGFGSRTWRWVNGEQVKLFVWGEDQPNNYNGEQNCVVLDGGRKWLWNDVSCNLDYLPWICQYNPLNCGSPERKINSTVVGSNYGLGKSIEYRCPVGNKLVGSRVRTCSESGFWTGIVPSCKYVDCRAIANVTDGKVTLVDERTTYNATAEYSCNEDYVLVGNKSRRCVGNGRWQYQNEDSGAPQCLYNLCDKLESPNNGKVIFSSLKSGGHAQYTCDDGHKLYGNEVRRCELGGKWTGSEPRCKFIDCKQPERLSNGLYNLVEGTTYFNSHVLYTCAENYTLDGPEQRTCLETGEWSGQEPKCKLVNCGAPDQPPGSYITEGHDSSYDVYMTVVYKCEPGHRMHGDNIRQCGKNGRWTSQAPTCQYIDCGRVSVIPRGKLNYMNETTHLGSVLKYRCSRGYKLHPPQNVVRTCQLNGRWSGATPKCQEIRCREPESPEKSTLTFSNNDRSSKVSFKIRSTVQYKCVKGYSVQGKSLRTCESNGQWSGQAPYCIYVDCGYPEPIYQGYLKLTTNTTYYGSTVEYGCLPHYRLTGAPRRLCLENGSWSHLVPQCEEVKCLLPEPIRYMIVDFSAESDADSSSPKLYHSIGDVIDYRCRTGYTLVGNDTITCLPHGQWTKTITRCQVVDCGSPTLINNGKGYLTNGTMTYDSMVQYECLPGYQLIGESIRTCLETGVWSGLDPRCVVIPDVDENEVNGLSGNLGEGHDSASARNVGIGVGIGIGALLLVIIIVAVVCMRTRKEKPVKNTENIEATESIRKDSALVTAYNRIDPNSIPRNQGTTVAIVTNKQQQQLPPIPGAVVYANNAVTNLPPSDGVYANVTVNGRSITPSPPYERRMATGSPRLHQSNEYANT